LYKNAEYTMKKMHKIMLVAGFCLMAVAALAAGKRSQFVTEDGVKIVGSVWMPEGGKAPAVILLHMWRRDRTDWNDFAETLLKNGYAVVSIDLRGHGESVNTDDGKTLNYKEFADEDCRDMVKDVVPVLRYLRDDRRVDSTKIAIIGASIGANMALRAAAADPGIAAVVLLSPGKTYRGVTAETAMIDYGKRPVLIAASEEDKYAATSSQRLKELAQGDSRLLIYKGVGHGTQMLDTEADIVEQIVNWLGKYLQ
jgi:dienelactone hydrolase